MYLREFNQSKIYNYSIENSEERNIISHALEISLTHCSTYSCCQGALYNFALHAEHHGKDRLYIILRDSIIS